MRLGDYGSRLINMEFDRIAIVGRMNGATVIVKVRV